MSDIHRKDDFLWSGVGLIYALVLWYCARNITGAVLLGQAAATALLVSYSWQTLKLRRAIANPERAAEINNFSVLQKINSLLKRKQPTLQPTTPVEPTVTPKVTDREITLPDTPSQDTAQKPARDAVPSKASDVLTEESAAVEDIKEPKLSEAKSSSEERDSQASNIEPVSQQTKVDTSIRDSQIVKPQPVKPKLVRDNRDNTPTTKNIEATPSPRKPEVVRDNRDNTPTTKNIEATPSPKKPKEQLVNNTSDRPQIDSDKDLKPESQATDINSDRPKDLDKNIEPEPQNTAQTPVKIEPVTKVSPLDSLETVEVAEVLEAAEDTTIDLDTDRSNIIEVTTTEINITTEVKKLEQPEEDPDFQEK